MGLLADWLESNRINARVMPYSGYDTMMEALNADEVDAIVAPDLSVSYDCLALVSIGFSDYYRRVRIFSRS